MGWFGLDFNNDGEISFTEHILSLDILDSPSCSKRRRSTYDTDPDLDPYFPQDDADGIDALVRDLCSSEDFCSDFDSW